MNSRARHSLLTGLPDAFPADHHVCHYRVLYGDTDAGGVVYYANYLRFFELGRTEFMRERIRSYRTIEEQGLILPVVECACRYRRSARYDDLLRIETAIAGIDRVSCRFLYRIVRQADDCLLAFGGTLHAPVDRKGRLRRFPGDLLDLLRGAMQGSDYVAC